MVEDDLPSGSVAGDIEVDESRPVAGGKRNVGGLSKFSLLVGVLVLVFDVFLVMRFPNVFFIQNLQNGISLALLLASVILSLLLITHAFGLGRGDHARHSSYLTGFIVPLVVGGLALTATITGMEMNRAAYERQPTKPCIDVIEQAGNIAKDNPKFRMSANDRDEIRCAINATLGR